MILIGTNTMPSSPPTPDAFGGPYSEHRLVVTLLQILVFLFTLL